MDQTLEIPFDSEPPDPIEPPNELHCDGEEAAAGAQEMELESKENEKEDHSIEAEAPEADPSQDTAEAEPSQDAAEAEPSQDAAEAEPLPDAAKIVAAGGKRKRGRPPKSQAAKQQQTAMKKKEKEEEEVCFICFDGGNLVCCDRRGCPKVYHAACINRDEAFFKTRGKWNCGWHICSICEKAAQYMCYTCTYSLCKGCSKENGFVCIRGNKGFCESCYSTVMLIESKGHANEGKAGIIDDKSSFECLFNYYWFDMKRRLSLTAEELQNPTKLLKGSGSYARKGDSSSDELYNGNDEEEVSSDSSSGRRGCGTSVRKKVRRRSRATIAEESYGIQQVDNLGTSISDDVEWASKELLELVVHMKGGDKSVLSPFDVQALLLEYIKQNNLRDPRRKSQIICDARLQNLFGKPRVGHFEMLKLLESHFLIKEASQVVTNDNQEAGVDPDSGQMDAEEYLDGAAKGIYDKRRKSRKKVEEREPQTNIDDYAAIDVHNISLIFLRRSLMEDLLDDVEKFTEKVIGSFVRIRIPTAGQKQDMYRLVQVVGTSKAAESYKTGRKTTDFILEILNLNKKEVITIDTVSNQDFTEEECKRLRQSIKCGLISRLTVGDIQEKAGVLQAVRVNDWLESEKQRLGHLRDRASETGRRKELRECVEKLQLLNTTEERVRRLNEIPKIHSDPKMDPDNESADDEESNDKNQDVFSRPRDSSLRKGKDLLSPGRGGPASGNWPGGRKGSSFTWDSSRATGTEGARDKPEALNIVTDRKNEPSWIHEKNVLQANWETVTGPANAAGLEAAALNSNGPAIGPRQSHGVTTETTSEGTDETQKIWHYKDPSGKIQGPFSMVHLRKWITTGYFPVDMRIWRASENEEDSVLLTDALVGRFEKDLPQWEPPQSNYSQPTIFAAGTDSRADDQGSSWRQNNHLTSVGNIPISGVWTGTVNIERQNADRWASQSPTGLAPRMEVVNPREVRSGIPRVWEPSRDTNAWLGQSQVHSNPRSIAPFYGNPHGPPSYQGTGVQGVGNAGGWNPGTDHRSNWSSNNPRVSQPPGQGYGQQHSIWVSSGQQSTRNQWGTLPTPQQQPSSRVWATAQGSINIAASPTPGVQPAGAGWGSMHTPASPTPSAHPMGTGWGTMNTPASVTPFQPLGTVWGTTSGVGINVGLQSAAATMEQYRAAPAANPVTSTGGWGSNSASTRNMANQITGTNAAHVPWTQQSNALNVMENCSAVFPMNEVISPSNPAVLGRSNPSERSHVVSKNHFFESGCPSPTPSNERQDLPAAQLHELNTGKRCSEANERLGSDPASVSHALGMSDPPCGLQPEALKSGSSNLVEESDPQDNMSPIRDTEAKLIPPVLTTKPSDESDEMSPLSTQRAEGWTPASGEKQDPDGQIQRPATSGEGHGWEQNQTPKRESSLQKPEHVKTGNLEGPQGKMRGDMWSLPSPTPATNPSNWNVGAVSPSGNGQNNPWISSDSSKLSSSLQPQAGLSTEQSWASQIGQVTSDRDKPSTGWDVAPQDANMNSNLKTGWGATAQGSENMAWGASALGNAKPSQGWGTPQETNMIADESSKTYPGWGTPTANQNSGWGTGHGDTYGRDTMYDPRNDNNSRYAMIHGGDSRYSGDLRHDSRYGGDLRHDGGDFRHDSKYGGDLRHDSRYGGVSRYDSRYAGGRSQWNDRMHGDRGGRSSRTPPRREGQGQGICKFHESGYCKKGASCNYVHS